MRVIVVKDKWQTYVMDATDLEAAALRLLLERCNDGCWYDDEAAKTQAHIILRHGDGKTAWAFLLSRRDHEYESVELQETR